LHGPARERCQILHDKSPTTCALCVTANPSGFLPTWGESELGSAWCARAGTFAPPVAGLAQGDTGPQHLRELARGPLLRHRRRSASQASSAKCARRTCTGVARAGRPPTRQWWDSSAAVALPQHSQCRELRSSKNCSITPIEPAPQQWKHHHKALLCTRDRTLRFFCISAVFDGWRFRRPRNHPKQLLLHNARDTWSFFCISALLHGWRFRRQTYAPGPHQSIYRKNA